MPPFCHMFASLLSLPRRQFTLHYAVTADFAIYADIRRRLKVR